MAHEHEYNRDTNNPMGYGNVDSPRTSSRGVLITLGIIALVIAAVFLFSSTELASVDRDVTSSTNLPATGAEPMVEPESTPIEPLSQPAPVQPVQ